LEQSADCRPDDTPLSRDCFLRDINKEDEGISMIKYINIAALLCFVSSSGYGLESGNYSGTAADQNAVSYSSEDDESLIIQLGYQDISDLNCLIVFERDNDIWLIDHDTVAVNLTNSGNVFSFTCDPEQHGLVLFSVINETRDMDVFALTIGENREPEYVGSVLNEAGDMSYFVTETYGDRAQMQVTGTELQIECDFKWGCYDFTDYAVIDLSGFKDSVEVIEIEPVSNTEDISAHITNEFVGKVNELFFTSQSENYRITNTSDIARWDEYYKEEPIDFELSPSGSKVLFSVFTDFGDLAHGPMLIVNIDGTNQQMLHSDMMFWNLISEWVDDKLLYIGYSSINEVSGLFLIDDNSNIPRLIIENVSQFDVILQDDQ
jgi:hypothetical protein